MEEDKHLYLYKDVVQVPILTMVDDALAVTECGYKTKMMNAFINTKTNLKKLQYGIKKCFKMHVGKSCVKEICPDLFVDGWKLKEVTELESGQVNLEDEHDGQHEMKTVEQEKYLGYILSSDGRNVKNISSRKNRAAGSVTQIMSILEDICFGNYYFEVAIILRNTLLISTLLTNAEAWYNLTSSDLKELEAVDEMLLRRILECPVSTPREMLYLELGVIPIRYIIIKRRLNFLQYILKEDRNSLIYTFLRAQLENPTTNDWGETVNRDLNEIDMKLEISEIEAMPKATFTAKVKEMVDKVALRNLNKEKQKHSKVSHIHHSKIEMEGYLKPNQSAISVQEANFLFTLRTRMLDIKGNYKGKYNDVICPCCKLEEDYQQHLLSCNYLNTDGAVVGSLPEYSDLFDKSVTKQVNLARLLKQLFQKRVKMTTK